MKFCERFIFETFTFEQFQNFQEFVECLKFYKTQKLEIVLVLFLFLFNNFYIIFYLKTKNIHNTIIYIRDYFLTN